MESADGPVFNQGRHEEWADVCAKLRAIIDADDAQHWNMDGLLNEVQRLAKGAEMKRWYESKLIWLGVLTVLGAVADGLAAGWGWRQLVVAGIGALIGVLRLATTKEITAPPAVPSLLLPLVLAAGLAGGCGATVATGLDKVQTGVEITWQLGYLPISADCRKMATACEGTVAKPEECKPWVKCDAIRSLWNLGHKQASSGLLTIKQAHEQAKAAGLLGQEK